MTCRMNIMFCLLSICYRLLPHGSAQGGLSKLDLLSESVMDKSALNDLENYGI